MSPTPSTASRRAKPAQQRSSQFIHDLHRAAGEQIDAHGVESLAMVALSVSMGRAPAGIYRYYANREGLLAGLKAANTERLTAWIDLALVDIMRVVLPSEQEMIRVSMESILAAYQNLPGIKALGVDMTAVMRVLHSHGLEPEASLRVEVVLTAVTALIRRAFKHHRREGDECWLSAAEDLANVAQSWFEHRGIGPAEWEVTDVEVPGP